MKDEINLFIRELFEDFSFSAAFIVAIGSFYKRLWEVSVLIKRFKILGIKLAIILYILLWLAVGKPIFWSDFIGDIKNVCRSPHKFSFMVNIMVWNIFGWDAIEILVIKAKTQFSVWV